MHSSFNFKPCIRSVKAKCQPRTKMLRKLSGISGGRKIKTKLIVSIYKSLVQPVIYYNSFIISVRNEFAIKKLEATQNKSLRVASRWPFKRMNKDMQKKLNIKTVAVRRLKLSKNPRKKPREATQSSEGKSKNIIRQKESSTVITITIDATKKTLFFSKKV